jgi:hypothetical protein
MIGNMTSRSRRKTRSQAPANAATTTADDGEETLPRHHFNFEGAWRLFRFAFFRLKINLIASKRSSLCRSVATAVFCCVGVAQRQRLFWSSTLSTHHVRNFCSNNSSSNINSNGMTRCNFPPRYVRHSVDDVTLDSHVERLDLALNVLRTNRKLNVTQERKRQESLGKREPFETHQCKAQHAWQLQTHPTCNLLYEWDMIEDSVDLAAHGYWRDVWTAREEATGELRILKTLRYNHSFTTVNYERHRRDAMAMERLTSSLYVVDIYAYCSNSGMFEYGNGGDMMDALWPPGNNQTSNLTGVDKLSIGKLRTLLFARH